jgi:hypothetical protein
MGSKRKGLQMFYWVYRLDYSVSDSKTVIIFADNKEDALWLATRFNNSRYQSLIAGPIKEIIR